jgi:hypothetical protein
MQTLNTSAIHTQRKSLAVEWERHWCSAIGIFVLIFSCFYASLLLEAAEKNHWHIDNLYSAIFGLSTFIAGFLFAIYTYVKTTENRTLDAIRQSVYFDRASRYMVFAMAMATVLSLSTIPFFVIVPGIRKMDLSYWLFCGWAGLTVYVAALSVRSLYHFITILNHSNLRKR